MELSGMVPRTVAILVTAVSLFAVLPSAAPIQPFRLVIEIPECPAPVGALLCPALRATCADRVVAGAFGIPGDRKT